MNFAIATERRVLRSFRRLGLLVRLSVLAILIQCSVAQTSVQVWGQACFDTRVFGQRIQKVRAHGNTTTYLTASGWISVHGTGGLRGWTNAPTAPMGLRFIDAFPGIGFLDDGSVVEWGIMPVGVPSCPPGLVYVKIANTATLLQRSDGAIIGVGPYPGSQVPTIPTGLTVVDLDSSGVASGLVYSDGSLYCWGSNTYGQCNVPPLPPGRRYVDVEMGFFHTLALRDDGQIVAFGAAWSQLAPLQLLVVPPLPAGTSYVRMSTEHSHCVALRSDGVLVAWGDNSKGQCNVPVIPPGRQVMDLDCGQLHTVVRLDDGSVLQWGNSTFFETGLPQLPASAGSQPVRHVDAVVADGHTAFVFSDGSASYSGLGTGQPPALPAGLSYERLWTHWLHTAYLRSDGMMVVRGSNSYGQCNTPSLPAGLRYTAAALGLRHTVCLRSDGQAIAFGDNTYGQCSIPPLPPGLAYTDVDADYEKTVLVRSDGEIVHAGVGYTSSSLPIPSLPAGLRYETVSCGNTPLAAIRSDGTGSDWGSSVYFTPASGVAHQYAPVPALPPGVSYVQVSCGEEFAVWRRSDGQVVVSGRIIGPFSYFADVPPLGPGESYVDVDTVYRNIIGRRGPTSTYVSLFSGCSGSMPAGQLVPRDTPKIGDDLRVRLFGLPANLAIMVFGYGSRPPVDLDAMGLLGGCQWHCRFDAMVPLAGQGNQAVLTLPIPDLPSLVGVRFCNQAIVLDPAAVGPGFVVSDAAEGVVGYP